MFHVIGFNVGGVNRQIIQSNTLNMDVNETALRIRTKPKHNKDNEAVNKTENVKVRKRFQEQKQILPIQGEWS